MRFASPVGNADAIYRNLAAVHGHAPTRVLVHIGDDARDIDYELLVAAHRAHNLGATVGCLEVPVAIAHRFTVLGVDATRRVVRSADKPRWPQSLPHDPARALILADLYVFDFEPLVDCLSVDAADPGSTHDLARDVLPLLVRAGGVVAHVLRDADVVSRYVPT
jgi:glucose-1-phosphate adenylyltransferase